MADTMFPEPPNLPEIVTGEGTGRKYVEAHYYTHMSETQAKAMKDVAKNTHAIPARQETYRFVGAAALVAFVLYELIPVFVAAKPSPTILALVIVGSLAILGAEPAIKAIIKAFQGGD